MNKATMPIFIGALLWILLLIGKIPYSFLEVTHVETLFLAAPLFLFSALFRLFGKTTIEIWAMLILGIFLTIAFLLPKGILAGVLAVFWLLWSIYQFFKAAKSTSYTVSSIAQLGAYTFWIVGAAWTSIDRFGIELMGYKPIIGLLTAVHFHYAGFILMGLCRLLLAYKNNSLHRFLTYMVLVGVPSVAIGISAVQFHFPVWLESLFVFPMIIAGIVFGGRHIYMGISDKKIPLLPRLLFGIGGLAICIGMGLAFLYGFRFWFDLSFLTIPWMYAVHGTLNAIGFAIPTVLAWSCIHNFKNKSPIGKLSVD